MRANLRYEKNQKREDVKSHHYIISFDPRDLSLIHILKAENQMLWVQSMNSIRNRAEEIIKTELIYC